jgi:hypothetical protein
MNMNRTGMWLALATAAWLVLSGAAAAGPTPPSQGPISDALSLRGMLPMTAPPLVSRAVLPEEGVIELERRTMAPVTTVKFKGEGSALTAYEVRVIILMDSQRTRMKMESVKFFSVTKEGKLEAIESKKAATMLKTRTAVLTGESAEVDLRHLEWIKPGTLYLVVPQPTPPPPAPGKRLP